MCLNYLVDSIEGIVFASGLVPPGLLALVDSCQIDLPFLKNVLFIIERERARAQESGGEAEREGDRGSERGSCTDSRVPDMGLELRSHEIIP